jgi:hypothetical protein
MLEGEGKKENGECGEEKKKKSMNLSRRVKPESLLIIVLSSAKPGLFSLKTEQRYMDL